MHLITVASLGKPFAVKGWQSLISYTHPPEQITSYIPHLVIQTHKGADDWQPCRFIDVDLHPNRMLVRLEGVNSPEQASLLSQRLIAIERQFLPRSDDDDLYWCDIIGLQVIFHDPDSGERHHYGRVQSLASAGGKHDILEVICDTSGTVRLIPFIEKIYIHKVDLPQGTIEVFWPPDY